MAVIISLLHLHTWSSRLNRSLRICVSYARTLHCQSSLSRSFMMPHSDSNRVRCHDLKQRLCSGRSPVTVPTRPFVPHLLTDPSTSTSPKIQVDCHTRYSQIQAFPKPKFQHSYFFSSVCNLRPDHLLRMVPTHLPVRPRPAL